MVMFSNIFGTGAIRQPYMQPYIHSKIIFVLN
jgi:hypothetical protein